MNTRILSAAPFVASLLFALAPSPALAAETRLEPINVRDALHYDCAAASQLRQQDVSRVFEVANVSQAWDLRERLRHLARRACLAGADRVVLIRDESNASRNAWDYVAIRD